MAMEIAQMPSMTVVLVVVSITLGFGAVILTGVGSGLTGDAATVVANGTDGLLQFASYLPILALVIVGALAIGILIRSFS